VRALDRFDRRRPFGPWLRRIGVNRAIDHARARGAPRGHGRGGRPATRRAPGGERAVAAAWAPRGRRLAIVVRRRTGDATRVLVAPAARTIADSPLFATTGRLAAPAWPATVRG
jgi:hypothetical protein